jgi:acyl-CoA dehydrogenase
MKIAQCRSLFDQGDGAGTGISRTLAKLSMTMNMERVSTFLSDALGMNLVADSGRWGSFAWNELVLTVPGLRIAGGTDEIHRNTIAERALGLPKDRRAG